MATINVNVDFDAAEEFLRQARAADQQGEATLCAAACRMVAIALDLGLTPNGKIHTSHLSQTNSIAPPSGG